MEYLVIRHIRTNGHPDLLCQRLTWLQYVWLRFRVYTLRQNIGVFAMYKR